MTSVSYLCKTFHITFSFMFAITLYLPLLRPFIRTCLLSGCVNCAYGSLLWPVMIAALTFFLSGARLVCWVLLFIVHDVSTNTYYIIYQQIRITWCINKYVLHDVSTNTYYMMNQQIRVTWCINEYILHDVSTNMYYMMYQQIHITWCINKYILHAVSTNTYCMMNQQIQITRCI